MVQNKVRPPGCRDQDGRAGSQNRHETANNLDRNRDTYNSASVCPARQPVCHSCGNSPADNTVLEVDVERQTVVQKNWRGKSGGKKPESSEVEGRLHEALRSADLWVEIERTRQEQGYPEGWSEQMAGFYGISPP